MQSKILVIGAHPDDETLGAGGTIAKRVAEGAVAELCIVTAGYLPLITQEEFDARRKEALKASKILGFSKTHFLELPAIKLDTLPMGQINKLLQKLVNEVQPDTIYTTGDTDINMDHTIVHEATMVAARPRPDCPVKRLFVYELPSSTEWGGMMLSKPFIPNTFVDISDTLETKIEAMAAYEYEMKEFPHPRSLENFRAQAISRGTSVGLRAAEAFRLVYDRSC